MRNREYWTKRFEQLEEAQLNKGAAYFSELENHYTRAAREVQKEINQWYARFAVNNEITLQEARKLLRADELKEFKWSVKDYIKHGEENNISGQWAKQLENASARWHITRLDALKLQMQNHVEMLFGYEQDSVTRLMEKIYSDGYYHTAYELQRGFNIGYDLMKLDTRQIEKVISRPWAADGSNFSSRIWKQKTQLVSELHTELTQAIIRGQNPGKITDYISHRFGVSKRNAGRLVMTEAAFFASASTRDCFNDLGVEQYEICATLDSHTSDTCQGLDGHVFKMSDYQVGVTAPPFHQWCRTTTVPYFDDEFELDTKRAARGEDGKTYYVPADMKYPEWKKAFVDGGSKEGLEIPSIKDRKMWDANITFDNMLSTSDGNEAMIERLLIANESTDFVQDANIPGAFGYYPAEDVIKYNPDAENFDSYDMNYVQAHELSHKVDEKELHSWKNAGFVNAIETCREKIYNNINQVTDWFADGGVYEYDLAMSDIISALSYGELNDYLITGHDAEYWKNDKYRSMEIFANISSIDVMGSSSRAEFSSLLEELYDAYKELVKWR